MTRPSCWVCIPTYNEIENVAPLVAAALAALQRAAVEPTVLVIDDNSPDGTGDLVEALAEQDPRIRVLHRGSKGGIGPAYIDGFRLALRSGADLIIEMDCDFSHDPADLPRLVATTSTADLVLGSRYIAGGHVANWGPIRRLISQGGSTYARLVLGLPIRDLTGGFKCFTRKVLETIPLDEVAGQGYVFQIEMTYRATLAGFTVQEIPITFSDRTAGESKMSGAIVWEAVRSVPRLRSRLGHRERNTN